MPAPSPRRPPKSDLKPQTVELEILIHAKNKKGPQELEAFTLPKAPWAPLRGSFKGFLKRVS